MKALTQAELVEIRRDFHRNPELSHQESRTATRVAEILENQGFAIQTGVAGHGVIATLDGALPGRTLLYRADMDALPITERSHHDYVSTNPGVMHACGHDVHTTIGLGVALKCAAQREQLRGRIKFMFQPAEEAAPPPGQNIGAEKMVDEGILENPAVDEAFALHVMPLLEVGKIGFTGGAVWAASELFDIHVRGKMAHGAYPHEGCDPILAASAITIALQQIASRNVDAREAVVVSVCRVNSGTAYNIIPEVAHLQGLIRTLNPIVRELALERFRQIVEATALAYGCSATVQFVRGTHLTANSPEVEARACGIIAEQCPELTVVPFKPQMGAEDFSAISRRVPSAYLFLGVRNEARGIVHMIHTPEFDVDEACLSAGVDAMTAVLMRG
jgi:amidohydrolase